MRKRQRRTTKDAETTNLRIGSALQRLRKERHWTLQYVAVSLGLSVPHVSALEAGQYNFSAVIVENLAALFQRPLSAFLREVSPADTLSLEWQRAFETVPERERIALLDLAKRLSWLGAPEPLGAAERPRAGGRLVSLEGVDGDHIHTLGVALAKHAARGASSYCPHDYRSKLWQYIMPHFSRLDREGVEHRALERSLLFACERFQRYEANILPALRGGKIAFAPFFSMASSVYQEVEGVADRRIVDIVETLLPKSDAIVVLRSDPVAAARKAVRREPKPGEFYSPYGRDSLTRAKQLYEKAMEEHRARGHAVHVFDVGDRIDRALIEAVLRNIATPTRSLAT